MARKARPKRQNGGNEIPLEQWEMPVTFDAAGNPVTLREYTKSGHGSAASFIARSRETGRTHSQANRSPDEFEVAMVGGGIVDKSAADRRSERPRADVGKVLTEIEERVIQNLLGENYLDSTPVESLECEMNLAAKKRRSF